jgi:opacity protein-like surface antigen
MWQVFAVGGVVALVSMAAHAEDGLYASLHGGASLAGEIDSASPNVSGIDGRTEFETGFLVGGAFGYRFGQFRGEIEIAYRDNDVESFDLRRGPALRGVGDLETLTGMVNVFYDADLTPFGLDRVLPYVGGGLGAAHLDADSPSNAILRVDGSDTVLAWNLQAGIAYAITEDVRLGVGYRYLDTAEFTFDANAVGTSGTIDLDGLSSHEVLASVRYHF